RGRGRGGRPPSAWVPPAVAGGCACPTGGAGRGSAISPAGNGLGGGVLDAAVTETRRGRPTPRAAAASRRAPTLSPSHSPWNGFWAARTSSSRVAATAVALAIQVLRLGSGREARTSSWARAQSSAAVRSIAPPGLPLPRPAPT